MRAVDVLTRPEETLGQVSGAGLDAGGALVLLAWLVAAGALVIVRYRRDALRV